MVSSTAQSAAQEVDVSGFEGDELAPPQAGLDPTSAAGDCS